jgi:hypothetical protein
MISMMRSFARRGGHAKFLYGHAKFLYGHAKFLYGHAKNVFTSLDHLIPP